MTRCVRRTWVLPIVPDSFTPTPSSLQLVCIKAVKTASRTTCMCFLSRSWKSSKGLSLSRVPVPVKTSA